MSDLVFNVCKGALDLMNDVVGGVFNELVARHPKRQKKKGDRQGSQTNINVVENNGTIIGTYNDRRNK